MRKLASLGLQKGWVLVGLWLALASAAPAQVPLFVRLDNSQSPPGLNWQQIETPHYRVIFPQRLSDEGKRVATLLEALYEPLGKTFQRQPERIPVLLNNQSAIANAFVAWAPRRTEWYTVPPHQLDEMGPIDWVTLLAVHEGRHVVQERAIRQGIVGALSKVFGQATTAFVGAGLYFPSWFWEGDAVGIETALTPGGRGRQPSFLNRIRAMRLAGEPYRYYQAWHGSYDTYYPDWYQLGYVLTTHVRRKYGEDAWRRVVARGSRSIIPPIALSQGLKSVTGKSLTQVHRDAIAEIDSIWREQLQGLLETPARQLTPVYADFHVWRHPQYASDGSVIAEYWDMSHVPALVRLRTAERGAPSKQEVLIPAFGTRGDQRFHLAGDRVVWSEYAVHPRFVQRSYLVLKVFDLATRQTWQLTQTGRHYGAALSPDGRRVVAVSMDDSVHESLVVLDAEDGSLVQRVANPNDHRLATPAWSPDGKSILVVAVDRVSGRGNALVRIDLATQRADTLIPFRAEVISHPEMHGPWIVYGSPASGIDNVEALDTRNGARFQITSRRLGARNPDVSPDGTRMLFQDYSVRGFDVADMPFDSSAWTPVEEVKTRRLEYFAPILEQEGNAQTVTTLPEREWSVTRYGGLGRIFSFHSLSLAPTMDESNIGLALHSRNVLNTFAVSAGVLYNADERTQMVDIGASWAGWYPIVDGAVRFGERADVSDVLRGDSLVRLRYHWKEQSAQVALRLPLVRLRGLSSQQLSLSTSLGVTHVEDKPIRGGFKNQNGDFVPVSYSILASRFGPTAVRDITPRGLVGVISYRHTPFAGDYTGHLLSARGAVFLPGLLRHHGVMIDGVHEEQRPGNYLFSSEYVTSRGYALFTHERFSRVGAAYHFPLWYPDLPLGPLAYVKRVQGAGFVDWGRGERRDGSRTFLYRSLGGELTTDIAPFQLRRTMRIGSRWSYRLDADPPWRTELLLTLPF